MPREDFNVITSFSNGSRYECKHCGFTMFLTHEQAAALDWNASTCRDGSSYKHRFAWLKKAPALDEVVDSPIAPDDTPARSDNNAELNGYKQQRARFEAEIGRLKRDLNAVTLEMRRAIAERDSYRETGDTLGKELHQCKIVLDERDDTIANLQAAIRALCYEDN